MEEACDLLTISQFKEAASPGTELPTYVTLEDRLVVRDLVVRDLVVRDPASDRMDLVLAGVLGSPGLTLDPRPPGGRRDP